MTSHDEQRLSDALRRQAETQDGSPFTLDDVTSRARGIQRRRVATGLVAAAAVAAVVVPTALVAAERTDRSDSQVATRTPDATPSVTVTQPTPTEQATPRKRTRTSVLGDLPGGAAPRIGVRVGDEVLTPDGSRVKVGSDPVYLAVVGDAVVTIERAAGGQRGSFVVRSTGGDVLLEKPASVDGALSVTPDRTAAAYVAPDGRIHTWSRTDGDLVLSAPIADAQLGPMAGSGSCKEQYPEGGGCTIVFNRGQGSAGYASSHGIVDDIPGFLKVNDASDHLYAGQTESSVEGSCSEIRRIETGRTTFKTCHYTLGSFSPDASHVIAGPAYLDGLCCATSDVLDTVTGKPALTLEARGGDQSAYIHEVAWEDATHVLAVVFDGSEWRVVRVGLDGSAELADIGEAPAGDVGEVPVRLASGS